MDWDRISALLEQTYGNPRHGNPEEPIDDLFYVMLSRKTPIATAGRTLEHLKELVPDWNSLPSTDEQEIAAALAGSGLEAIRASHIRQVAAILLERFGSVTLDPLRAWSDEDCLKFLTTLPGVGVKTALCVMMYALGRRVFPADAHCIRVLKRLRVIPDHLEHRPAQRLLARIVPQQLAYKLHVSLVAHGQQVCRARTPDCGNCALRAWCPESQLNIRIAETPACYIPKDDR